MINSYQIYTDRQKFVEPTEKELWDKIPVEAMSSEEDASDNDEILYRYTPSWRSDGNIMSHVDLFGDGMMYRAE